MIMKTISIVQQPTFRKRISTWLLNENCLFTTLMEGETMTNLTVLKIANTILAFCFLIFSPGAILLEPATGYLAIGICLGWVLASLLCFIQVKK